MPTYRYKSGVGERIGDLSTIENRSIGTRVQADEVGRGKGRPHSHSAQVLERQFPSADH
jgi:hypothetical protein